MFFQNNENASWKLFNEASMRLLRDFNSQVFYRCGSDPRVFSMRDVIKRRHYSMKSWFLKIKALVPEKTLRGG